MTTSPSKPPSDPIKSSLHPLPSPLAPNGSTPDTQRPVNQQPRLELIETTPAFQKLAPHWDQLLATSAVRTPFLRWDWVNLWWKHFRTDHQLLIGAAWGTDGQLLALTPFTIGPGIGTARRNLRHLSLIGGLGEVVAEGLDLICQPGFEPVLKDLLDLVFLSSRDRWDTALFGFMDPQSPFYPILQRALHRHATQSAPTNPQNSPIIRLQDHTWDSYLQQRSISFRKKYRRLVKHSSTAHQVTFKVAETPAEAAQAIDTLMELHAMRWTPDQSLFLRPRTQAFHQELATLWCPTHRAALLTLCFDGQPVAANYAFADGPTLWDYQGGWSPDHIIHSPAKLIMAENLRWALAHGISVCDMLPGDLAYKAKWTSEHRTVVDLIADNPTSLRMKLFHSMRLVKKTLTALVPKEP
jgi:CelD/BcsL family acetyltransferase involved in cellulose biosynthesis